VVTVKLLQIDAVARNTSVRENLDCPKDRIQEQINFIVEPLRLASGHDIFGPTRGVIVHTSLVCHEEIKPGSN
jgi:hypothetical protein